MDKFDPITDGGEMEHPEEALGQFVIACGDGTINLQVAEHAFDPVSQPVEALVPADGRLAMGAWRDHGADAARSEIGADRVAIVALVGEQGLGRPLRQVDQRVVTLAVRRFATREVEGERPPLGITDTVNLTGEPAPRAAKSLFASPPFAPAAETWPRTVVESML